jgi:type VI secretion system protein
VPHSKSLLSRIESPQAVNIRTLPGDTEEEMASIHEHLQLMLNTRHGSAETVPEFGTSDFSDFFRGHESIDVLRNEIWRSIEQYEPRLTNVHVTFEPRDDDPYRIHFEITADVVSEEGDTPTVFRTVLEGTGEAKVTRG